MPFQDIFASLKRGLIWQLIRTISRILSIQSACSKWKKAQDKNKSPLNTVAA